MHPILSALALAEPPPLGFDYWKWFALGGALLAAFALALLVERFVLLLAVRLARLTPVDWDDALVAAGRGPLRLAILTAMVGVGAQVLELPERVLAAFEHGVRSLVYLTVAWLLLRLLQVSTTYAETHTPTEREVENPARLRRLHTQFEVLRRVAEVVVYVVTVALLLMQFSVVRNVGVSLLASAGIAGLVIGFAAQQSIATLLAGIQLSVTQPLHLGDHVALEEESGVVEEITLTYVVVALFDGRRLVVPITHLRDKPFENWSKGGPHLLALVNLTVDFTVDLEALREELARILAQEATALWDGREQSIAVTDMHEHTLTVRALASAADPDACASLRNLVRERLVVFLQRHPQWLPLTRTELHPLPAHSRAAGPVRPS